MRGVFPIVTALVALVAIAVCQGCGVIGYVAATIPRSVDAQYTGLAKQKIAVMVWADRGVRIDYPNLQLDISNGIQADLIAKTGESSLEKAEFPWEARSVVRFQRDHPELEGQSITEWVHRVSGITRLVFVEVPDFSTRAGTAVQLLKGGITMNVKVLEVGSTGPSKIIYEKQNIRVYYPPKSPEGVTDVAEGLIYRGTVNAAALEIAQLFYPHVIED